MTTISITLNGEPVSIDVQPRTHLADLLREQLRATGTHLGCEHGVCGSCTVLLDGVPVRSCITLAVACEGRDVRTIEGFTNDDAMEDLRSAFRQEHALQCGFCTPGMLIAARDIVLRLPDADESRIRRELAGNLCRCTGYLGIVRAVRVVIETRRARGGVLSAPAGIAAPFPSGVDLLQSPPVVKPAACEEPSRPSDLSVATAHREPKDGWTTFAETFVIQRPAQEIWSVLNDFPAMASCIPGAELLEHGDNKVKGRMTIRIGPINAAFSGTAMVDRDDATRTGNIRGAGTDSASKSRTTAAATYRVVSDGSGSGTRVVVNVEYNLQGPLAQFSRSSLAQEIGRRLVNQFADNLNQRLSDLPRATDRGLELNMNTLLWSALRDRVRLLLSRLAGR